MNSINSGFGGGVCDALIMPLNEQNQTLTHDAAMQKIKTLLGTTDKTATAWDLKVSPNGRAVLLRAAGLPHEKADLKRKFADFPPSHQHRIREAALRASEWVCEMGLV